MIGDSYRLQPNFSVPATYANNGHAAAINQATTPPVPDAPLPTDQAAIQMQQLRGLTDQALRELTEKAIQAGLSAQLLGALGAAMNLTLAGGVPAAPPPAEPKFKLLSQPGASLDDVGALADAKGSMQDLVNAFRNDSQGFTTDGRLGPPKLPFKGYLMHGWSGAGKSHLVKSVTGELNQLQVPVVESTAGDFAIKKDDGNGTGPDRLANLFAFARKQALESPTKGAVIVLEDIDALLPIRGDSNPAGNAMVTRFLSEMDALATDQEVSVTVIGTTSRKDLVDVTAANRLEKELFLLNPRDSKERREILGKVVEQNGWKLQSPDMLQDLAETTTGRTAKQLKSILQDAARNSGEVISERALDEARMTHFYGPAQAVNTNEWAFRLSVAHELGHAVIRHFLDGMADQDNRPDAKLQAIDQLIFQPRGESNASVSLKYSGNPTKTYEYYFGEISSNYGGRAAEYLFGDGHVSAGPGNDIEHASRLANEAVTQKGMGANTGPVNPQFAKVEEEKVQQDTDLLLKSADEASTKIVKFYQDFIGGQAEVYAGRAFSSGSESLVMSGKEFKSLLAGFEVDKADQLNVLRQEIRALRDKGSPKLAGHDQTLH